MALWAVLCVVFFCYVYLILYYLAFDVVRIVSFDFVIFFIQACFVDLFFKKLLSVVSYLSHPFIAERQDINPLINHLNHDN